MPMGGPGKFFGSKDANFANPYASESCQRELLRVTLDKKEVSFSQQLSKAHESSAQERGLASSSQIELSLRVTTKFEPMGLFSTAVYDWTSREVICCIAKSDCRTMDAECRCSLE